VKKKRNCGKHFVLSLGHKESRVMSWATDLAQRKKRELSAKATQQEKDLSDRKMLDANIDSYWKDVCEKIKIAVAEYNEAFQSESITLRFFGTDRLEIAVRNEQNPANLYLDRPRWTIVSSLGGNSYTLTVIEGNGLVWKNRLDNRATNDMIAQAELHGAVIPRL
jgi:hypothetical protein